MEILEFILNNIFFLLLEGTTLLILFLVIIGQLDFLRTHWLKSLLFVLSYPVLHHFLSYFDYLPITLFHISFCILALAYLTKTNLYASILANIILFLIYGATEVAVSIPVLFFMGTSLPAAKSDTILQMKALIIIRPIHTALIILLTRYHFKTKLFQHKLFKKNSSSVTYLLLIIFFMSLFFTYIIKYFDNTIALLTSGFLFLFVILLSILDTRERVKLMGIENQLKLQKEYSRNMELIVDAVRKEKHDFKNQISTLIALCTMQEPDAAERVRAYARKLINNADLNGFRFYNTGNKYLDGLLSVKSSGAVSKDIHFEVDIETTLETISVDDVELTSIVGNILDNAFDAVSMNPRDKKKIVSFSIFEEDNKCCISISNNGMEIPELQKKHIFDYKYSTKNKSEGERGYGLYIVKELISRNQGEISFHSNEFETEFLITFQNKADSNSSAESDNSSIDMDGSVFPR